MPTFNEPPSSNGKFLNLTGLHPGDVILSYGGTKMSKQIASATKGPFSHAAIVRNYMQRVEALDDGVGLTNHRIDRIEVHGQSHSLLMKIDEHPTVVLRHKGANTETAAQAERFDRELYRLQGLPYADWGKFLNALPDEHFARSLVDLFASSEGTSALLEGRFCSECVAETYEAMEWDLPKIRVDRVSPNDLWRLREPDGPLEVRNDLIVDVDDTALQDDKSPLHARVAELQRQFLEGRHKLEEMKNFKLGMATAASRRRTIGPLMESFILSQIEMLKGTDSEHKIPAFEAKLGELRQTLKKGEASDHALGLD